MHEYKVEQAQLDLQQVQADEIKVKRQEGHFWMGLAIMVSTRLWLGGVMSVHRNLDLIQTLANTIQGVALCRPLLLAVDGLASYVTAFRNSFRTVVPPWHGEKGRPSCFPGQMSPSCRWSNTVTRDTPLLSSGSMSPFANASTARLVEPAPWFAEQKPSKLECTSLAVFTISVNHIIACI
jgi:hypothetical protein